MTQQLTSQLRQTLRPSQLLPNLTAGLVAGIITLIVEISLAAMVFSGDLSRYVSNGIGFFLFGTFVIGVVTTLASSFSGSVAVSQDSPAAILALVAATIAGRMPDSATPEDAFFTVVAAITATSLLTGIFFWVLGLFKLGDLVRYIPHPVVGGFLAGTGWLLFQGAIGVMTDVSFSFSQLAYLFQADVLIKWLPGGIFAVLLLAVLRRYNHFLIIPSMLLGAIGLFYTLLWLTHTSVTDAGTQGWLLGPFPEGGLWQPLTFSTLGQVNGSVILSQVGNIGTVLVISVISLLLNASGIELTVQQDIDLNRELQAAGIANVAAGLGGGPAGYQALSLSALGHRIGSASRLVGIFTAVLCGTMLFFGASILSYFPKPILGGLLCFLGLAFLVEWLYDGWFKLPKVDYFIVLLILVAISTIGVLQGVGLGIALTVVLFVVKYSRISIVKHTLSGTNYRSNVERPRLYQQLLRRRGQWLYILKLQGFIFFGTANKLLNKVRQRIDDPDLPTPRFIVMDFRQVTGLDTSAVISFTKMKHLAQTKDIVLIFAHLAPRMQHQLETEVLTDKDRAIWRVYVDLDHALEWCEEQMIQTFESVGITAKPRTVKQQLEQFLPRSGRFATLLEFLADEDQESQEETALPSINVVTLGDYMERQDVEQGHYLIQQGEIAKGFYFVETGQLTVQIDKDGKTMRLRKMEAGTVVGEVGAYLGSKTTASVVADQPSTVYYLSTDSLKQMEKADPQIAAAFHKFIAQLLSERLSTSTDTLYALLE